MAAVAERRGLDAGFDHHFRHHWGGGRCGVRLVSCQWSDLVEVGGGHLCGTDPQHAVHCAVVLHLLWLAGGRCQAVGRNGFSHRHGGESGRLRDGDYPRRH